MVPSTSISLCGTPPLADTWFSPVNDPKTITPSEFQVPPLLKGASQRVSTGPPAAETFFSLLSTKNPMYRLSGDQNGSVAPSVPASACAWSESSGRTHIWLPSPIVAMATYRPSGDTAKLVITVLGGA